MTGHTRKFPLQLPRQDGNGFDVPFTVRGYNPEGVAIVVESLPLTESIVMPEAMPVADQSISPLMPEAIGAVPCVNAVPAVDCNAAPGVTAIVGQFTVIA